ncbi:MAG: MSMEG_4193 family putative phosphomutase [Chloroflexi bacterium]|jgi:probable phosphomutase (TIGR03848 family)|nr:MSMEG_4193 family putative phosphomutase [Chloroflexota bacterium]
MPTILLIRHAENEYVKKGRLAGRLPGVQLNKKGRQQAQALAETLKDAPIKAIYVSPLERTLETAAPIAAALNLDVIPNSGLLEIDFGDWQDKTLKELRRRKLWRTVQQAPSRMCFPGGESFAAAQARIITALEALCQKHSPKEMLICVSHSDSIKLAVAYYLGMHIDHFQRLMIAPASITTLFLGEGQTRVINVNMDAGHKLQAEH